MPILEALGPGVDRSLPAAGGGAARASPPCRCRRSNGTRGRARHRASLRAHQDGDPAGRVAVLRALREGDQRAEGAARRRHPGAQLPDAGDLPLRRRLRRQLAAARASRPPRRRPPSSSSAACTSWRRPSKILNPDKTVLIPDRRAGCSLAAVITGDDVRLLRERFPGVPVVAYVNTSAEVKAESRHLLHLVERRAGGREPRRRQGDLPARPVSRQIRRVADRREDHRLEGRLRGARALHRATSCAPIARPIRRCRSSRIRNARPTCWPKPTSPARPRT